MDASVLWDFLRAKARIPEFEIQTVPQGNRIPLWFRVGIKEQNLLIRKSLLHTPSVNIASDRVITFKDFQFVYICYQRWMKGDSSGRQEAQKHSQNTAYIYALIAEATKEKEGSNQQIEVELNTKGNHAGARNVNRDVLINKLGLNQVSNTTIYLKGSFFVLSPSVQNAYNWLDLRLVNLKQFDRKEQKGFLLIRFFDKFLMADLRSFLRAMVSKENYVKTKVSGVHWKFVIKLVNNKYVIVNQKDKKEFVIEEVSLSELEQKFTIHNKQINKIPSSPNIEKPKDNNKQDNSFAKERQSSVLSERIVSISMTKDQGHSENYQKINQSKNEGLFHKIVNIFRGS